MIAVLFKDFHTNKEVRRSMFGRFGKVRNLIKQILAYVRKPLWTNNDSYKPPHSIQHARNKTKNEFVPMDWDRLCISGRDWCHIQDVRDCLNGSSSLFGAHLFQHVQNNWEIHNVGIWEIICFEDALLFLVFLKVVWNFQVHKEGVPGFQKSRNPWIFRLLFFPTTDTIFYPTKTARINPPELLNLFSHHISFDFF